MVPTLNFPFTALLGVSSILWWCCFPHICMINVKGVFNHQSHWRHRRNVHVLISLSQQIVVLLHFFYSFIFSFFFSLHSLLNPDVRGVTVFFYHSQECILCQHAWTHRCQFHLGFLSPSALFVSIRFCFVVFCFISFFFDSYGVLFYFLKFYFLKWKCFFF